MMMFTSNSWLRTPAGNPGSLSCGYRITKPVLSAALPKKALERPRLGTATQRQPRTEKRGLLAKRRSAKVLALQTEEVVQVALDAYKLLGISTVASRDSITKAYERVVDPQNAVYCEDLLFSRAVVLKAAADTLLDSSSRRGFDQSGLLDIPEADLPGAIVLLAEAGDWSTALEWGQAWLSINSSSACAKDVACCVASAYCDQAAAKMEKSADVALECQAALKLGLALLRRHDCGQALQAEIQQTLQELEPQVALQLISEPASSPEARSQGIALLKTILWDEGSPAASFPVMKMNRRAYVGAIRSQLSASEQCQLFEGSLSSPGTTDEETYDTALAYLAAGFRTHTPAHIQTAIRLLQGLDNRLEPATGRKRFDALDVSVELAVCLLLVGNVDAAERALGLDHSSSRMADPGVRQFVQSHCEEGSTDMLPGMYTLAQQWMADVAVDRFPELRNASVDIDQWFSDPRVSLYLQVVDKGKQLQLGSFGHSVRITLASILGHCAAVLAAIWGFLTALAAQPLRGRSKTHLPGAVQEAERPTAQVLRVVKAEESEGRHEARVVAARSNVLPMGPSSRSTPRKPPVISIPQPGSDSDAAGLGPEPPASARKEPAASQSAQHKGDGSQLGGHIVSKPRLRQQLEKPLAAVANQTVGEIQQQMQDAMPLEEEEDGFSTEYLDAPLPQPPRRRPPLAQSGRSAALRGYPVPGLLAMEGEREMWVSYQGERRRVRLTAVLLALACLGFAIWAGMRRQGFPNLRQASPVQTAALAVLPAAHAAQATLSRQEAQQLLQRWEGVKQEALGAGRAVGRLQEVLDGGMLKEAMQGARTLKQNNMYLDYELKNLAVVGLDHVSHGRAIATAKLQETETLKDSQSGDTIKFAKNSFDQAYELVQKADGSWKIVGHKAA